MTEDQPLAEFVTLRRENGRPIVSAEVQEALDAERAKRAQLLRCYMDLPEFIIAGLVKHLRRIRRSPEGEWLHPLTRSLESLQPGEHVIIERRRDDEP